MIRYNKHIIGKICSNIFVHEYEYAIRISKQKIWLVDKQIDIYVDFCKIIKKTTFFF